MKWVLLGWWLLLAASWTGCGPNVSLDLPNGYSAVVMNASMSWINPPSGIELEYDSVPQGYFDTWIEGLDVQGDLVIGEIRDSTEWRGYVSDWPLMCYFVIDTSTHTLQEFQSQEAWLDWVEAAGGSRELNRRSITPFFYWGRYSWVFKLGVFVVLSTAGLVVLKKYLAVRRHNEAADAELYDM